MASQRNDPMAVALKKVWARGGIYGCTCPISAQLEGAPRLPRVLTLSFLLLEVYQGLIPWAWIEASTKGAVLLFTAAEIETATADRKAHV